MHPRLLTLEGITLTGFDRQEHLRACYRNNPMCMEWRQHVLDNNPRGRRPNYNPTEIDDIMQRVSECAARLKEVGKFGTWEAAGNCVPTEMECYA